MEREYYTNLKIATVAGTFALCTPLALLAIIFVPIPGLPAASGFWLPAAVYFVMTMWFGIYGALGGHLATFVAMGFFFGYTIQIWANGALGDFLGPLVAVALFKKVFRANPELSSRKDKLAWVISVVIASFFVGVWVHSVNYAFGVITLAAVYLGIVSYTIGDSAAILIFGTWLLKYGTKRAKALPIYVKGILR